MKNKILIFIITYKASFRLLDIAKKIPLKYLKNKNYKILISDDSSNDDTIEYISKFKNKFKSKVVINLNKKNHGYGANIKRCIKYAFKNKFNYAVMIHGDNQYDPKYSSKMIHMLIKNKNISAATGSRMLNKSGAIKGRMPIYKFLGNIFLTGIFNILNNSNFTDCHTGYWAYNLKNIKKDFFLNSDDKFCFDIDLRLQLLSQKKEIKEIPINTYYGSERSSMHIVYAIRFFIKTIKFKLFGKL